MRKFLNDWLPAVTILPLFIGALLYGVIFLPPGVCR